MRRAIAAVAVAVLTVLTAGCAVGPQGHARAEPDDEVPFRLLDPDAQPLLPTTAPSSSATASLCFVDGDDLVSVPTPLDAPITPAAVVAALAEAPRSSAGGRRTAVTADLVGKVGVAGGIATVDLRPAITDLGHDEQLLAVAQLVCTLTNRPGVGPVAFTLDGSPVDVPRADGSLTSGVVSRDDYADLLP